MGSYACTSMVYSPPRRGNGPSRSAPWPEKNCPSFDGRHAVLAPAVGLPTVRSTIKVARTKTQDLYLFIDRPPCDWRRLPLSGRSEPVSRDHAVFSALPLYPTRQPYQERFTILPGATW